MTSVKKYRWPLAGALLVMAVFAFLAFRPDKLFVDDVVDESLEEAFSSAPATTSTTMPATSSTTGGAATQPSEPQSTTTTTPAPRVPIAITGGTFHGIDHSAAGTATIYEQDGAHVLRFEDDTDIQNGPDLWVWVLQASDYDEVSTPDAYIELGRIKGNVGGQNYELPAEFDPEIHRYVLIWCKRFSVPFAAAPLA